MLVRKSTQTHNPGDPLQLLHIQMKKMKPAKGTALFRYHIHKTAKPRASFLDSLTHALHSVPSSHFKYQATLTLTHRENILFLRVHSDLGSRGLKNQSPCSGQEILLVFHFFLKCSKLLK